MSSQQEHRHHPRREPPRGVSLTLRRDPPAADEEALHLLCRDVSRTGLGVAFPHSITPDTDVELWVTLPGDELLLISFRYVLKTLDNAVIDSGITTGFTAR